MTGLGFLVRSSSIARTWVGASDPPARTLVRSVGARDAAIGLGLATQGSTPWLLASIAADLADGTEAAIGDVPADRRRSVALWAFGFAAYGLIVLSLRGQPSPSRRPQCIA